MPSLTAEQLAEVTSVLFAAALDQSRWQEFLTRLSTHTGMISTHLYGYDLATDLALEPLHHGYDPAFMKSYVDHYGKLNAWAPGLGRAPIGQPVTSAECMPEEQLFTTEFYNDWVRPQGDVRTGAGVVLARDSSRLFVLGGNMAQRHAHREQEWVRTLGLLAPHMCLALEIGRTLFDAGAHTALGAPSAPGRGGAVFVVTKRRQVRYANRAALALAETGQVLAYDHAGRIALVDPEADAALSQALANMSWVKGALSGSARAQDDEGNLRIVRFARIESERLGYIPVGIDTRSGEPHLLVSVNLDETLPALRRILRERYGLTESEIAVSILIGDGLRADEIAHQRDVSVHTVRDQIKAGLRKTGVGRQAGLVRLLNDLRREND
ncbi:helix-turn-helix transcriptional regulator [Devosia sp. YIM 151766]|uniref:helix-turn-helix transcriptional regulator n=1 Tax=Devosia sp. YIM 151766 TaxID=3017325 RepID=UPI00255CA213|nr:helix-turn-helix transcriptional regulator [Devosia sp. YIM 151766]WIY54045.1 helix-turn-helix transcriptional regulator [Devosia sp. YIM 151766]